jgi:hypothetical protein
MEPLSHVCPLSGWVSPVFRPYRPGYGFPLPFGWPPSLFRASLPPGELFLPCGWPPGLSTRPQEGLYVPHTSRCVRGGCPLYSGAQVSPRRKHLARRLLRPFHRNNHRRWANLTKLTRIHLRSPVHTFPCLGWVMVPFPSAFTPALRPRRCQRCPWGGNRSWTLPGRSRVTLGVRPRVAQVPGSMYHERLTGGFPGTSLDVHVTRAYRRTCLRHPHSPPA